MWTCVNCVRALPRASIDWYSTTHVWGRNIEIRNNNRNVLYDRIDFLKFPENSAQNRVVSNVHQQSTTKVVRLSWRKIMKLNDPTATSTFQVSFSLVQFCLLWDKVQQFSRENRLSIACSSFQRYRLNEIRLSFAVSFRIDAGPTDGCWHKFSLFCPMRKAFWLCDCLPGQHRLQLFACRRVSVLYEKKRYKWNSFSVPTMNCVIISISAEIRGHYFSTPSPPSKCKCFVRNLCFDVISWVCGWGK